VMELKKYFQSKKNADVEADIYAQLGGYLIDKNEYTDVRDILDRARKADPSVPETHYHLARYFRVMKEPGEEKKALVEAKTLYREVPPLSFTEESLRRYIDSYNRLGELYYAQGRTGLAEIEFDDAISIIEDKQSRKILNKHPDLGLVYYNRGSLFYDAKLFNATLAYFKKAEENLYRNPEMNYKTGYVHYRNEDHLDALIEFYKAERGFRSNTNVIFAIGNSLYFRGDYFAAQGYYNHLFDILEKKRDAIEILRPFEEPEHKSLINYMMRTYNNLGVTLIKLSDVSKNARKESEGLVYLTKSAEHYDILDRLIENPQTMERDKVTKNLAYLNQRHIFFPQTNYELLIYNTIPLNSKTLDIDNLFSTKIEY
jgi:tetratricopeptide (TPR) repeat protein